MGDTLFDIGIFILFIAVIFLGISTVKAAYRQRGALFAFLILLIVIGSLFISSSVAVF